ncbi:MAG: methyl-accepting chemotaxis protein [Azoarcus sp.]|jgi:methyl-accepting chemotaxis protein|nr:methyl-accepting chemotaxis protein [Azoarcus sp.]
MSLEKLRVNTRLRILVVLGLIGLLLLSGAALHTLRKYLVEDRKEKVVELVESAYSAIEQLYNESQAGRISVTEAQNIAKTFIRAARYDEGRNYIFVIDGNVNYVVFPPAPEDEGVNVPKVQSNASRVSIMRNIVGAARSTANGGFYNYLWPKPPSTDPIPKITYARYFEPWGWAVITGIYIDDVDEVFREELYILGGITVVIMAAILLGAFLINRSVMRQLGGEISEVVESAHIIARGDLTREIPFAPIGEGENLASAINAIQHKLRDVAGHIDGMVQVLVDGVERVSRATAEIGSVAEEQARASNSTAAEIEEISGSIGEVSNTAAQSEKNAVIGNSISADGARMAAEAGKVITQVSNTVELSSQQIELLVQKSVEIGSIAKVIRDVADQTNLLALNAAIEAARAGEQGRGFAVVADEVRKLAERTTQATGEINAVIAAIQQETQSAVTAMGEAKPQVEKGLDLAKKVHEMLEGIHKEASSSLDSARMIAHATQEQATAVNDLAKNMAQIATLSEQSSAAMKDNAVSIKEISGVADKLKQLVSFFKL